MAGNNFISINEFNGGVNTDLDEHRLTRNQCEYLLNGEILDFDGNIGVLTNKAGNRAEFVITDGFRPLAHDVINGVAFILSVNATTGEGEIGCYPAPDAYVNQNTGNTGYLRQYSPLWNFCTANDQYGLQASRSYLRTTAFAFNYNTVPSVRLREDYDQSVNIYFCDGINTDKVINSGFNIKTGAVITERTYGANSFPNFVELINESPFHPNIATVELLSGGSLKNGNWKIFIRYTSYDYNPTSFLTESNMIMVSDINPTDSISATAEVPGHITNKAIKLVVNTLDAAYRFVEIGYIHYFGDTYESGIIDKRYDIVGGSATILFTGNEKLFNVDLSQIIVKKTNLKISTSITALDGRLFRGNTKRQYDLHNDLALFALAITGEEDYWQLQNFPFYENDTVQNAGMYKFWENVYHYTGYWSAEAYPFAIIYVFKDGSESDAYPISGVDYYNNSLVTNSKGIIRFPDHVNRDFPIYDVTSVKPTSHVMGIKFNTASADLIYSASQYMQDNIVGFYIARGERKKNIMYQGFLTDTYTCTKDENLFTDKFILTALDIFIGSGSISDKEYIGTDYCVPFIVSNGIDTFTEVPQIMYFFKDVAKLFWGIGNRTEYKGYQATEPSYLDASNFINSIVTRVLYKKALFSADHFFLKSLPKKNYFLQVVGKIPTLSFFQDNNSFKREIDKSYFFQDMIYQVANDTAILDPLKIFSIDCIQQTPWNSVPLNGFSSMMNEGSFTDPMSFAVGDAKISLILSTAKETISVLSCAMGFNSYIGLKMDIHGGVGSFLPTDGDNYNILNAIVNTYIDDPLNIDIENIYDPKNLYYTKISKLLPIIGSGVHDGNTSIMFNGDCFINRVAQRVVQNPNKYPTGIKKDTIDISGVFSLGGTINIENYISSGQIIEYVAECNLNHYMRLTDGNKSFYPTDTKTYNSSGEIPDGYTEYAVNNLLPESDLYNRGFSATGSLMQYRGFLYDLPEYITKFPNRIMGSNNHILNGFKDGYRQFALGTYSDYNFGYGAITDLQTLFGQLVCIMEHHIGLIPINERAQIGTSSGELLIGVGGLLPLKQQELSQKVGCQQKSTIINSGNAIYGWDWQLRKIWRADTTNGIQYISDTRGVAKWINNLIDVVENGYSDIMGQGTIKDICVGFDYEYGDVYWTYNYGEDKQTICYSEKLNLFKGWYSFIAQYYLTINEDFYSVGLNDNKQFWLHDDNTQLMKYYDEQFSMIMTFIINDKADMTKVFDNIIINSSGEEWLRLDYETLTQISSHSPFLKTLPLEKWLSPKYKNDSWHIPLNRTESVKLMDNNTNSIKSKLRGNWLRITLEFDQNKRIFVKSILTHYNISNH